MQNYSYEKDFVLHKNETAYRTHFHMKGFVLRLKTEALVRELGNGQLYLWLTYLSCMKYQSMKPLTNFGLLSQQSVVFDVPNKYQGQLEVLQWHFDGFHVHKYGSHVVIKCNCENAILMFITDCLAVQFS